MLCLFSEYHRLSIHSLSWVLNEKERAGMAHTGKTQVLIAEMSMDNVLADITLQCCFTVEEKF